jgi:hypothetical protein
MAIAGYAETSLTDSKIKELVEGLLTRQGFVTTLDVETPMGRRKQRVVTVASLGLGIRAQTGRTLSKSQLVERLEKVGYETFTAYRGTTPMTVVLTSHNTKALHKELEMTG